MWLSCAFWVLFATLAIPALAQEGRRPQSLMHDWSHRHVLYTGVGVNPPTANAAARDPRALSAFVRTITAQRNAARGLRRKQREGFQVDWAFSMGTPNTNTVIAPDQYPATFAANFTSPSCANDYLVMPVNIVGGGNANLIGVNQLYSNAAKTGFCSTVTGPTVLFAYQTGTGGGANATSMVTSLDGTKVAWVENSNPAKFHVLAWKNEGTVAAPIDLTGRAAPSAPVAGSGTVATVSLSSSTSVTNSSPFVDYDNDLAYVGDNTGHLYRIKNVFCTTAACIASPAAPSLDTAWSTNPVTLAATVLTAPVASFVTGDIYVGGANGNLYIRNAADGSAVTGSPIAIGAGGANGGIVDPPIVDSTGAGGNELAYVFTGNDTGVARGLGSASVVQTYVKQSDGGLISISRTGSCSAAVTSCTFSATATGDLKIVFAYRSGSTTAPTLPAGWTSIATGSVGFFGTTGAFRIGCNVSASGADTATGAWTNASGVVGISYAGTAVDTTANCNTTGIGATATSSAQTSTTVTYPTITLDDSSGSSWVAGFMGDSTSSNTCTPTGMTSVTSTAERGSDTNAGVSSWPAGKTCSVTSSTWMSYVAEILAKTQTRQNIGAANTEPIHMGALNDAYYTGAGTARLYACSVSGGGGSMHIYRIPFSASRVIGAPTDLGTLGGAAQSCSPLTAFNNGTNDRLFLDLATTGVLNDYVITSDLTSSTCPNGITCIQQSTATGVTTDISGIIIDNGATGTAQAANIYFGAADAGNITNGSCWTGTTGATSLALSGTSTKTSGATFATGSFTTAANHGLAIGEMVAIAGTTNGNVNGNCTVATTPTTTTFTCSYGDNTAGSGTGGNVQKGTCAFKLTQNALN